MGLHALLYTICGVVFFNQKKFFKNTPINIALYTILISIFFTILNTILIYILDKPIKITSLFLLTDFIFMPVFDGIYALICFGFPLCLIQMLKKRFVNV